MILMNGVMAKSAHVSLLSAVCCAVFFSCQLCVYDLLGSSRFGLHDLGALELFLLDFTDKVNILRFNRYAASVYSGEIGVFKEQC